MVSWTKVKVQLICGKSLQQRTNYAAITILHVVTCLIQKFVKGYKISFKNYNVEQNVYKVIITTKHYFWNSP